MRLACVCAGLLAFAGAAAAADERNPFSLGNEAPHVPVPTSRFPFLGGGGFAGRGFRPSDIPLSRLFSLNNPSDLKQFQEWMAEYVRRHPEAMGLSFDPESIRRMESDLRRGNPRLWERMQRLEQVFGRTGRGRPGGGESPIWARHVMEWVEAEIRADPTILSDPNLAPTIQRMLSRMENRMKNPGLLGGAGGGREATLLERWLDPESPDSPFSPDSWLGQQGEDVLNRLSDLISAAPDRLSRLSHGGLAGRLRDILGVFGPGGGGPPSAGSGPDAGPLGTAATAALLALACAWILFGLWRARGTEVRTSAFPRPGPRLRIESREDLIGAFLALSAYALQREFPPLTHDEIRTRAGALHPRAAQAFERLAVLFETAYYHPDPARIGPDEISSARLAYREASERLA